MDLSQYAELFRSETREHLSTFNQLLLDWEQTPENPEPVAGIFRAVHTVKGMAATMGYGKVADLAHRAESLLDRFREAPQPATPHVLELLFETADAIENLVEVSVAGRESTVDVTPLLDVLDEATADYAPAEGPAQRPRRISFVAPSAAAGRKVTVAVRPEAPLKGARALLALRNVEALGDVHGVEPAPAAMEGEEFDGRFGFRIETAADPAAIEAAIEAAGDIAEVTVHEYEGATTQEREALARTQHIRVDLRRLDALMNQIGELVTARGHLGHLSARRGDPELDEIVLRISQLTSQLRTEIIEARMTPVWQVFDRFPRVVRDLARQLGKQVAFRVEGKEIELDRAILDELGDPLLHLLRNAVDHGIEASEERTAAGKPAEGQLVLSAIRERSTVAILVRDDGQGIDRGAILEAARRDGLVAPDADHLPDDDLLRVLARAGFSTAAAVSDVSGRGVGIDVVMTRIRALGGALEVHSEPGAGTTFTLRLPVTLAIVRALLARVGDEQYALPLTHVQETVELAPEAVRRIEGQDALLLRDEVLPLVRLRDRLAIGGESPPGRPPVIVLRIGDRRRGVVVDRMVGQQEIVVKNFDPPRGTVPVFSGATILGDGHPVLILDAGGLV